MRDWKYRHPTQSGGIRKKGHKLTICERDAVERRRPGHGLGRGKCRGRGNEGSGEEGGGLHRAGGCWFYNGDGEMAEWSVR